MPELARARRAHFGMPLAYSWPHGGAHRWPRCQRSHAPTAPIVAHLCTLCVPHRKSTRKPKCQRPHAATIASFGTRFTRFVTPSGAPPNAAHTTTVPTTAQGVVRRQVVLLFVCFFDISISLSLFLLFSVRDALSPCRRCRGAAAALRRGAG
eukprot:2642132-Pyramimonas_sp.AAC.1